MCYIFVTQSQIFKQIKPVSKMTKIQELLRSVDHRNEHNSTDLKTTEIFRERRTNVHENFSKFVRNLPYNLKLNEQFY